MHNAFVAILLLIFTPVIPSLWGADITLASGVTVAPGESTVLPLFLTNAAPPGGVSVALSSSDTTKLTISPDNIYVAGGLTAPFAQPRISGINFGTATITASAYGLSGASQAVQVSARLSGPGSQTMQRDTTLNVIFSLSAATPTLLTLNVTSDNAGVASVPANVTIPANGTTAVIPVTGVGAGTTNIHVSALPNIAESVVGITVVAPAAITVAGNVSMPLGASAPFPVMLGTAAPAGGTVVTLASSDPATVSISPGTVFIPAGATAPGTQAQVTGQNIGIATITASSPGYVTAGGQVAVTATITMTPQTLIIPVGGTQLVRLALSTSAPSTVPITPDRGANGYVPGITAQLSSSDPRVATLQPSVQFYPDGSSITTVVVVVNGAAPGTAVIHAGAPPFIPDVTATVIVQ